MIYLQQEDQAHVDPQKGNGEDEGGAALDEIYEKEESFMYFIRNGKFSVHVKVEHLIVIDQENQPKPVTHLIDGDHFGEIGMIFDSKRTATVRSENYGTLAILKMSQFIELSKTFELFSSLFKKQIFKYHDPLTTWLFMEMEKIQYFKNLSLITKQELIYSMERHTYEKGSFLCKTDVKVDRLYLIQEGIVEVAIKYDRRRDDQNFVIERLGRGAIINHQSFMVNDDADTDFVCRTTVSAFYLTTVKLNEIMAKRQDLLSASSKVGQVIYAPLLPLALDYIFHNNDTRSLEQYEETLKKNQLRVKFKNAIMQHWTKVKEESQRGSLPEMIDQMLKRKRSSQKEGMDYKQHEDKKEELKQKMEQRKVRKAAKLEQLERESKDSYINI